MTGLFPSLGKMITKLAQLCPLYRENVYAQLLLCM